MTEQEEEQQANKELNELLQKFDMFLIPITHIVGNKLQQSVKMMKNPKKSAIITTDKL